MPNFNQSINQKKIHNLGLACSEASAKPVLGRRQRAAQELRNRAVSVWPSTLEPLSSIRAGASRQPGLSALFSFSISAGCYFRVFFRNVYA
jgi:hypothetical protein